MNQKKKIKELLESAILDNDSVNATLYRTGGYDTEKYCFINLEKYNQALALLNTKATGE